MRTFVATTAASMLLACAAPGHLAGSNFTQTGPSQPATTADRVELVFGGHAARPYRELGVAEVYLDPGHLSISGEPATGGAGYADMLAELRRIGAGLGCDAMLVNPMAYPRLLDVVSATCVAYLPDTAAAR